MKGLDSNTLRSLSLVVAGAVLLCHVMGALCVMVPSPAMAETVAVGPPPVHAHMTADHGCWQYVPSSGERLDGGPAPALLSSQAIIRIPGSSDCRGILCSAELRSAGTPIHAFLSTFRI